MTETHLSQTYLLCREAQSGRTTVCRFVNDYIIWTGVIVSVPARWLLRSLGAYYEM
jgi:hypothetical protein